MLRASTPRPSVQPLTVLARITVGAPRVLGRRLVGRVDLAVVVAAAAELAEVVVGQVLDQPPQPRIGPEEVLADVGARRRPRTSGTRRRPCCSSSRPGRRRRRARAARPTRGPRSTLITFQPAPRKRPSSSWMILPLPRTGPSRRWRLQLTTKVRLSRPSRAARAMPAIDSGSSISPSPRKAHTRCWRGVAEAPVLEVAVEAGLVDRPRAGRGPSRPSGTPRSRASGAGAGTSSGPSRPISRRKWSSCSSVSRPSRKARA